MGFFWRWIERLRALVGPRRYDEASREEMQFHIDMEIRERMAEGLSPEEARRVALRDFGGVERFREQAREARWATLLHDVIRDARLACRALLKRPGYTAVVLGTLALGIGATTAVFTVVNGVLFEPLPYPEPDRLVRIQNSWTGSPQASLSPAEFVDLEEWLTDFEAFGAYSYGSATITGDGRAERARAAFVSAGVWDVLGVAPAAGRTFTVAEDRGSAWVAVLTDAYWQARFGADPRVVGSSIQVSGFTAEVVGVLPPDFRMPEDLNAADMTQVIMPLGIDPVAERRDQRGNHYLRGVARLAETMSFEDGDRRVREAGARMVTEHPLEYPPEMDFRVAGVPLRDDIVGPVRPMLTLLFGAMGLVFAIVAANVANLLLTRLASRGRELALRRAIGAGRSRIMGQILTESLVLAVAGGVLGIVAAGGITRGLLYVVPSNLPRIESIQLNSAVLGFGLLLALVGGLLFGAVPALYAGRGDLVEALRSGVRETGLGRGHGLRRWLVTAQVSLAVVLAVGAALVTRSFVALSNVDPGFRTENVVSARFGLPSARYGEPTEVVQFFETFLDQVRAHPGVDEAGAVTNLPLATRLGDMSFELEEARVPEGRDRPDADWQVVTPGYFEALDVAVLSGRGITTEDRTESPGVVVINETMARAHWPGQDPIGRRIRLGGELTQPRWAEVVGIVNDVSHRSLDEAQRPQMYFAHSQFRYWSSGQPARSLTVVAESSLAPQDLHQAIRGALADRDPELALYDLGTLSEARARSVARPRFTSMLLGGFSGVALLLALVGVYGVMMYAVRQQTREFGIRIALGAAPGSVVKSVVRQSLRIALPGIAIGMIGALASSRLFQVLLYEVSPTDPVSLVLTTTSVLLAALLASFIPARMAAGADPIAALRSE